uniref:Uncharacterized protein n=1 Tax=viral metagenome TaxID=1070528 RepID=A0A6C0CBV1_9ZZZZ
MDIVLLGDLFVNVIVPILIPIDLYHLAQTCKSCQKKIKISHVKKSVINEINRRLYNIFNDDFDDFKSAMRGSGAIISGSFIIQCILGEYWRDSDIDIYVNTKMFEDFHNPNHMTYDFLNKKSEDSDLSEHEDSVSDANILKYMTRKNYFLEHTALNYDGLPAYIIDFKVHKTKIQFIGVPERNIVMHIINNYDFDICKNAYKFDDIFDGETNLFIYRLNDIFCRCTNFAPKSNLERNIKRYLKYHRRGFNFYSYNKDNMITRSNIWDQININIIKMTPIRKTYRECRSIMSKDYEFTCCEDIIMYKDTCHAKNIFKLQDTKLLDTYIYRCHNNGFDCLFDYHYPNICHLHLSHMEQKNLTNAVLVLDDFYFE